MPSVCPSASSLQLTFESLSADGISVERHCPGTRRRARPRLFIKNSLGVSSRMSARSFPSLHSPLEKCKETERERLGMSLSAQRLHIMQQSSECKQRGHSRVQGQGLSSSSFFLSLSSTSKNIYTPSSHPLSLLPVFNNTIYTSAPIMLTHSNINHRSTESLLYSLWPALYLMAWL